MIWEDDGPGQWEGSGMETPTSAEQVGGTRDWNGGEGREYFRRTQGWAFCIPPLIQGRRLSQGSRFAQPHLPRQPWRKDPQGHQESPSPEAWTLDYDSGQAHRQIRLKRTVGQAGKGCRKGPSLGRACTQ